MPSIQCLKKSSCQMYEKFAAKKLLSFIKVAKPVLKLMRKKQRTNAVTPSSCNYDIVESLQNDANESELFQLDFKFFDDYEGNEADENIRNEELEKQLLKKSSLWAPRSDIDIWKRGDEYVTSRQLAESQVPVSAN